MASHRLRYWRWGLLRPTSTLQEPLHTGQPPSSRCTVHALGVKSWGVRFIGTEFCLAPPTAVADIFGPSTNDCFADKDETALAVLACVAGVSDKSTRGDFVN